MARLDTTYRNVNKHPEYDELCARQLAKLQQVCPQLQSCSITVERPHRSGRSGQEYRVRLHLSLPPGQDIAVSETSDQQPLETVIPALLRDAFSTARKQLDKLASQRQERRG